MNTPIANPSPTAAARAWTDADVKWFGASARRIGGRPDSRYGWLDHPGGPCIVKAIDPQLTAYSSTLQQHERKMLRRLTKMGAPTPELLDLGRDDWLVTRFAGLSVQRLSHPGGLQGNFPAHSFGFAERLSAWVHLLRRLQAIADKGVLAIDLYDANVVVPLTEQTQGQLRLTDTMLIDHAHTLEAGMNMCRPVWLNSGMGRVPPELRNALHHDQQILEQAFARVGAELPGYSQLPGAKDELSRRVWAEYNAPQQLQQLLDQGSLSRDHAMQFAAGVALGQLLPLAQTTDQQDKLSATLGRMTHVDAEQRYPTLTDAAQELTRVLKHLPLAGRHHWSALHPLDLSTPPAPPPQPVFIDLAAGGYEPEDLTDPRHDAQTVVVHVEPNFPKPKTTRWSMRWIYLAAASGAILGALWPVPW